MRPVQEELTMNPNLVDDLAAQRSTVKRSGIRAALAASVGAVFLLGGCASTPAPTAQIQAAQQAIADAERAGAGEHAAGELTQARNRLASANTSVQDERMEEAARLAEEARVDAELAAARTAAAKALAVNDEMKRSTKALVEEMQRNTGNSQ